jgi:hypothetical protein
LSSIHEVYEIIACNGTIEGAKKNCFKLFFYGQGTSSSTSRFLELPIVCKPYNSSAQMFLSNKPKSSYNKALSFQDSLVAKFPWVEFVIRDNCLVFQVRCMICTFVERKEKYLSLKLNILYIETCQVEKNNYCFYQCFCWGLIYIIRDFMYAKSRGFMLANVLKQF